MNKTEKLAYIAGLIDGEGCLGITKVQSKNSLCYYERMSIHMKDPQGILLLCEELGLETKRSRINGKPYYSAYACSKKLKEILIKVKPFLQVKQREAELLLSLIKLKEENPRRTIWDGKRFMGTMGISEEQTSIRNKLYEECKTQKTMRG